MGLVCCGSSAKKKGGGTFTFCVTNVEASGYTYDPALNIETCDSISAPGPTPTPTATPTPTPSPTPSGKVYVNDITMGSGTAGPNKWATATVWIKNDSGGDVEGATVYGEWTGAVNETDSGVTGPDGKVTLTSSKTKTGNNFTFCVTDVVGSGYTYDPALNNETCDTIVVNGSSPPGQTR